MRIKTVINIILLLILIFPGISLSQDKAIFLKIIPSDNQLPSKKYRKEFKDSLEIHKELKKIIAEERSRAFLTASIDSIYQNGDSLYAVFFKGKQYYWGDIEFKNADDRLLRKAGIKEKYIRGKLDDITVFTDISEKLLEHLENSGYPFASIKLKLTFLK